MRLITIFLLCIPLLGLSIQAEAQEAIFVYGKGTCTAVDIQNVNEIKMTENIVDISLGVNYRCTDVDSITFREPEVDYGRIGWWGSPADGPSACYYQSFHMDYPDMTFEATDSVCTSAFYYLSDEDSLLQSRRRVGRKWRYVKNTLSGRRKFQIHQQHAESDNTKMDENGRIYLDLTNQFCNRPVIEARKAVNMWYHPQDTASMPKKPLFGTIERNSYDRSAWQRRNLNSWILKPTNPHSFLLLTIPSILLKNSRQQSTMCCVGSYVSTLMSVNQSIFVKRNEKATITFIVGHLPGWMYCIQGPPVL